MSEIAFPDCSPLYRWPPAMSPSEIERCRQQIYWHRARQPQRWACANDWRDWLQGLVGSRSLRDMTAGQILLVRRWVERPDAPPPVDPERRAAGARICLGWLGVGPGTDPVAALETAIAAPIDPDPDWARRQVIFALWNALCARGAVQQPAFGLDAYACRVTGLSAQSIESISGKRLSAVIRALGAWLAKEAKR